MMLILNMKKNILILTGSPRKDGNSEKFADAFLLGAHESGHTVTKIRTANLKIKGCLDCKNCFTTETPCCIDDDFNNKIAPELEKADVLVLVTPLYWFTYTAQLKLVLDKMYAYMRKKDALNVKEAVLLVCGGGTTEPSLVFYYLKAGTGGVEEYDSETITRKFLVQ